MPRQKKPPLFSDATVGLEGPDAATTAGSAAFVSSTHEETNRHILYFVQWVERSGLEWPVHYESLLGFAGWVVSHPPERRISGTQVRRPRTVLAPGREMRWKKVNRRPMDVHWSVWGGGEVEHRGFGQSDFAVGRGTRTSTYPPTS